MGKCMVCGRRVVQRTLISKKRRMIKKRLKTRPHFHPSITVRVIDETGEPLPLGDDYASFLAKRRQRA
jgi:hypothetical protein